MKFICDVMLGKLAQYLRILGLDTVYIRDIKMLETYKEIDEPPYFFTKRSKMVGYERCIFIKSDKTKEQLKEISHIIRPFIDSGKVMNRCMICNIELIDVAKADIEQLVPEFVFHKYEEFKNCPSCGRVYWEGSHTEHMAEWIEEIAGHTPDPNPL
jgi:uncharacterized protein with PIN domain